MLRFLTAGESHGPCLLAIVEGLPAGLLVDVEAINTDLRRRQGGYGRGARMQIERDRAEVLGGVWQRRTTGAPLALRIENRDWVNWRDRDLPPLTVPRPGHADYAGMTKYGLDDARDLFLRFIVKMHESVKKHGRKTLMWESFPGDGSRKVKIPKEIIVFAWETAYQLPQDLLENGYTIINASWKPLYVTPGALWGPETIYDWNLYRWENWVRRAPSFTPIQLEETDRVVGAQMCSWEMHERDQIPDLRKRLPAFSERIWNPEWKRGYGDFRERLEETDVLL